VTAVRTRSKRAGATQPMLVAFGNSCYACAIASKFKVAALPGSWPPELEFSEHFLFGVPDIDRGHAELIGLLNQMRDHEGGTALRDVLHRFSRAYAAHCRAEESFLRSIGYVDLQAHSREHSRFNRQLTKCCQAAVSDLASALPQVVELYAAFAEHMLDDLRYKSHVDQMRGH